MDVGSVVTAMRKALYITLALCGCARAMARPDPGATSRVPEEPLLIEFRLVRADPFPGSVVKVYKGDTVYIEARAILSDPDLRVVEPDLGEGRLIIAFEATDEAGRRYRQITEEHVGEQLALLLEGEIAEIVTIRSSLGPSGVVAAHMPREQATRLAILIQNRWRYPGVSRDTSSTLKTATLSFRGR